MRKANFGSIVSVSFPLTCLRRDHDHAVGRRLLGAGPAGAACRRGRADRGGTCRRGRSGSGPAGAEPPGIGRGREDLGAGDRLAGRVDHDAVELGRAGELQVGPGPVGLDVQPGAFAGPEPEIGLRQRVRLHLDLPRACLDRVSAVGVGLGLADGLEGVLGGEQRRAEADPRDPLAGLGVDDPAGDRHVPLERDLDPGDGVRADLDLLGHLGSRAGIAAEDGEDLVAARRQVVEPEAPSWSAVTVWE